MKRYITIVLLASVLVGALGYFFYTFWKKTQSRPLEDALLQNTSFYLSTAQSLEVFSSLKNLPYGTAVYGLPVFERLEHQLTAFDSILRSSGYTLSGVPLIASLYATGAEQYDWLFLVDGRETDAQELLGKLSGIKGAKINKRIYKEETVLDIQMPNATKPFSCASLNGILMGSFSAFLVEEGIVQLREKDPLEDTDPHYRKIRNHAGKEASLSLFFNPAQFKQLGRQFIDEMQTPFLGHLTAFSSWMALDVNLRNGSILLGGYTLPHHEGVSSLFNKEATLPFEFDKVLPATVAVFAAQELVLDMETSANAASLNGWLVPAACYGLLEPLDKDYATEWFLTLPVTDEDLARQSLAEMARTNAPATLFKDALGEVAIGQLKNDTALVSGLGIGSWLPLNNPYYAVYKGHAFFANEANTLKKLLGKVTAGSTLATTPAYVAYVQEVSATNSLYLYLNPARMGELMPLLVLGSVLEGKGGYQDFGPIGLQFNYDDGVLFTYGLIQYNVGGTLAVDDANDDVAPTSSDALVWRLPLDTQMIGHPHLVTNHTTNELEVVVQDARYNIYLVSKAGKILWRKSLDGAIIGDVHQIDLYKNSKLQLLFNTEQKLHLIDRNGNNVEQFPIGLQAKATNGLFVMDDGRKNYQYFLACDNYKVYGYTANGKPLQGWNPKPRVGTIPFALQKAKANGKDYLILTNVDGTLLYYNINGERHEKPIRLEAKFNQPFCVNTQGNTFQLVNASEDRVLFTIDAKGNVKESTADALPPYQYFTCAMVDSSLQYIFVSSDKVTFTKPDLSATATFAPTQKVDLPARVFSLKNDFQVLGLVSTSGNEVYLLDMAGQLLQGLPIKGNTLMTVGHLFDGGDMTLLVGDAEGNLNAYRLP